MSYDERRCQPAGGNQYQWNLRYINATILCDTLDGDSQPEDEYDVVSVSLKEGKHVGALGWGIAAETNLDAKRTANLGRI